ncbi:MAG: serine/threonine-protein phosphatase [Clostridia bacterium]|nr:serine/threonine-protein phosphatase [Clostridia bacterium]
MQYFANSDRGRVRRRNEDRYLTLPLGEGVLLAAVFDGMGGHTRGDLAAEAAAGIFREVFSAMPIGSAREGAERLRFAAREADAYIRKMAEEGDTPSFMGTTVTALLVFGREVMLLNVGDSRTYLFREGDLSLLTHDDSYVQKLVDAGKLTPEEAALHPRRNVITRSLGALGEGELSVSTITAHRGDSYLLSSDGLYGTVGDGIIRSLLAQQLAPSSTVGYLIAKANENGGEDNITAALVRV